MIAKTAEVSEMNTQELLRTANALVADNKGLLAIDEAFRRATSDCCAQDCTKCGAILAATKVACDLSVRLHPIEQLPGK
jgi:hypothetical protein